jgi:hypothetical protein
MKENQPDKTRHLPDAERTRREALCTRLNIVYERLGDAKKKAVYDASIPGPPAPAVQKGPAPQHVKRTSTETQTPPAAPQAANKPRTRSQSPHTEEPRPFVHHNSYFYSFSGPRPSAQTRPTGQPRPAASSSCRVGSTTSRAATSRSAVSIQISESTRISVSGECQLRHIYIWYGSQAQRPKPNHNTSNIESKIIRKGLS